MVGLVLAAGAVVLGLAGCASPEIVPSSGPRPPTAPQQVKVFQKAPAKYELLGPVAITAQPGATWDEKGNATAGFDRMRSAAAALGANGLLLAADPGTYDRMVTVGDAGKFYQVAVRGRPPTAVGHAIFVLKE
jgi:hypothetical protein